jgi:CubicO group peptidase (beta-lactamase class C family)
MYTVASYAVEVLSGESFSSFLQKRLWKPLQMFTTYHDVSGVQASSAVTGILLAHGYRWDEAMESYIYIPCYDQPEGQGAGLIFSSVKDYAKWIRTMISGAGWPTARSHT